MTGDSVMRAKSSVNTFFKPSCVEFSSPVAFIALHMLPNLSKANTLNQTVF